MARFTMKQFEKMLEELGQPDMKYDTALEIAQTVCMNKPYLDMSYDELESMQDVVLAVYQNLAADLGRMLTDESLPVDVRAAKFGAWLRTTRANGKRDQYREKKRNWKRIGKWICEDEDPYEPSELFEDPYGDPFEVYGGEANIETLRSAFDIVIAEKSEIYIRLAWLGVAVFMIFGNMTKIASTNAIYEKFEKLPMKEYYKAIVNAADYIHWLTLTDEQKQLLEAELNKVSSKTGKTYGDSLFSDFYMKKGGPASISDWINKLNERIRGRQK